MSVTGAERLRGVGQLEGASPKNAADSSATVTFPERGLTVSAAPAMG